MEHESIHPRQRATDSRLQEEPSDGIRPQGSKRMRYVSKACDECRRRKTRCDGSAPCRRCSRKHVPCSYSQRGGSSRNDTPETTTSQIRSSRHSSLEDRIRLLETLTHSVHDAVFRGPAGRAEPTAHECDSTSCSEDDVIAKPLPQYCGPTSSQYTLECIEESLASRNQNGLHSWSRSTVPQALATVNSLPPVSGSTIRRRRTSASLQAIDRNRLDQACDTYATYVGSLYALVDMASIRRATEVLRDPNSTSETQSPIVSKLAKSVVAIGLALDTGDKSSDSERIMASIKTTFSQAFYQYRSHIDDIRLLALLALYYVHTGDELLASRTIGIASRTCLEMGLHRFSALQRLFPSKQDLSGAADVFWSVYMLDRRASLGFGISSIIQDCDIDSHLPLPTNEYLASMVDFGRLTGKIFASTTTQLHETHDPDLSELEFLDFQIERWYRNLSPELTGHTTAEFSDPIAHFISTVLYARKNQARILVYRPCLLSTETAKKHLSCVRSVIQVACDTLEFFSKIASTSSVYTRQPVMFNHFIISAATVLLLASTHAPSGIISNIERAAFESAMSLLGQSFRVSQVAARLRAHVSRMERLGTTLSLTPLLSDLTSPFTIIQTRPTPTSLSRGVDDLEDIGVGGSATDLDVARLLDGQVDLDWWTCT